MSYWITFVDAQAGTTLTLPERHEEGGTYVLGGTDEASLNITYNYGRLMAEHHVHIRDDLHGKRAVDTIPALAAAVAALGSDPDSDYWQPTSGNVGRCCAVLLRWAQDLPDGIWICDEGEWPSFLPLPQDGEDDE